LIQEPGEVPNCPKPTQTLQEIADSFDNFKMLHRENGITEKIYCNVRCGSLNIIPARRTIQVDYETETTASTIESVEKPILAKTPNKLPKPPDSRTLNVPLSNSTAIWISLGALTYKSTAP